MKEDFYDDLAEATYKRIEKWIYKIKLISNAREIMKISLSGIKTKKKKKGRMGSPPLQ